MYPVASSVPVGAGDAHWEQRRRSEAGLLRQFTPRCFFWRLAAPNTATGQVPPGSIRGAHQQEVRADIDRHYDALMPRARQSPPDASKRKTKTESCPPGKVEK